MREVRVLETQEGSQLSSKALYTMRKSEVTFHITNTCTGTDTVYLILDTQCNWSHVCGYLIVTLVGCMLNRTVNMV